MLFRVTYNDQGLALWRYSVFHLPINGSRTKGTKKNNVTSTALNSIPSSCDLKRNSELLRSEQRTSRHIGQTRVVSGLAFCQTGFHCLFLLWPPTSPDFFHYRIQGLLVLDYNHHTNEDQCLGCERFLV
jgi:hypothetical protein